jgi:hypothetical protein
MPTDLSSRRSPMMWRFQMTEQIEVFRYWSPFTSTEQDLEQLKTDGWNITGQTMTGFILSRVEQKNA